MSKFFEIYSRCGAVRLAHLLWEQGAAGSNPATSKREEIYKPYLNRWDFVLILK